ncbi:MAG: ATP-binding cassette domain-containing protein [Verrucomicrobia bacterium]|nr:ATP-binding cassette domain-containing protein [Verrucomicrobiota bacterium]
MKNSELKQAQDAAGDGAMTALLEVRDLKVHYAPQRGLLPGNRDVVRAVDGVSFSVGGGETVGLVGESGSGKTTVGRAIIKLTPITDGTVLWEGRDVTHLSEREFRPIRKHIQMIFQDPYGSLNPRLTVESIVGEAIEIHFPDMTRAERRERVAELMSQVGLQPEHIRRYPHEFSGGQRQRIGIARALAVRPRLIICDEPVSALDVSVQAQIINLLQDLQEQLGLAYLFIGHDLGVVEHVSNRVLVMNGGRIVESGSREEIYQRPQDPYTRNLLAAVPTI